MSSVEALKDLRLHRDDLLAVSSTQADMSNLLDRAVRSFELPFQTTDHGAVYTREKAYELLLQILREI
jgi:hypothetical protein